jgi:hypothetical protein
MLLQISGKSAENGQSRIKKLLQMLLQKKKSPWLSNEAKVLLTSSPFLHITKGIVAKLI